MRRFADIDLDDKDLTPISGYWDYPLVSLKEALQPILPRINQLETSIIAALKDCHYPSEDSLTRDESGAIYLYTMEKGENSIYQILNRTLRAENRDDVKPWFPYIKLFNTALGKLPNLTNLIWRGIPSDVSKNFKKGEPFTWWGMSSCSLSVDVIKGFLSKNSTLFCIQAVNGKHISTYSMIPWENEVLLMPGTQLDVVSNSLDVEGLHIIQLKVVNSEQLQGLPNWILKVNGACGEYRTHLIEM